MFEKYGIIKYELYTLKKENNGIKYIQGTYCVVDNYYGMYGIKNQSASFRILRYANKLFIHFLCAV